MLVKCSSYINYPLLIVSCSKLYHCTFADAFGGDVGVVIVKVIEMTGALQYGFKQFAETEVLMIAVERILEYGSLQSEAPLESSKDNKPNEKWPALGEIDLEDVRLQYDKTEKIVLKGLTFRTNPREKIGIVGRTGAGTR